eukprot:jgi/Picre1/28198/NNA_003604.t1
MRKERQSRVVLQRRGIMMVVVLGMGRRVKMLLGRVFEYECSMGVSADEEGNAKERKKSSEKDTKSSSKKKNKEKRKTSFSAQLKTTVTEALKKHGGEMKKKKLLKSLESFLEKHGCTEKKVEKKLGKSSAFSIDGKMVKLV